MRILIAYDGSSEADAAIADLRRANMPGETEAIVPTVADVTPSLLDDKSDPTSPGSRLVIEQCINRARRQSREVKAEATSLAAQRTEHVRSLFPTRNVYPKAVSGSPYWAIISCAKSCRRTSSCSARTAAQRSSGLCSAAFR